MGKMLYLATALMIIAAGLAGYFIGSSRAVVMYQQYSVTVATTTSLYQIGVLNDLFDDFNRFTGLNVRFNVLAKGSGEALRLLADGSACLGFVHAPSLELQYLNQGRIERLATFAYNDFIVVGPSNDPANISSAPNVIEAFKRIYNAGEVGLAKFVSRGDMSGTNVRELQIWNLTKLNPEGRAWYLKSGQGMAQTLIMADDLNAYTLTDRGTYLNLVNQGRVKNLVVLKEDPLYLVNVYSMYLSKAGSCDNPYTWYIAYKFRDYLMDRGQDLLSAKYKGLVNPVKGNETWIEEAWEALTKLG
ncbi:substrate-binding domain-containing protein [Thermogladius sp. 4427co]|uniref:substrate-binding domain-containing protein n=1 Tax=Thermogladius sp. 4427co TaxID=3450718 RepID=UPI003F7A577D